MDKNYIVSEDLLKYLLISNYKLQALNYGGVDNWEWYGEALWDFLDERKANGFEELALEHIKTFEEYKHE